MRELLLLHSFLALHQPELLPEVVELLQNSAAASHGGRQGSNALQIEQITRVMQQWGQVNGIMV